MSTPAQRARQQKMTKDGACERVAKSLRTFGYPDVTAKTIRPILDAWLAGKREDDLPGGVIGMFAGRQFDDVEAAMPGTLAALID